MVKTITIKDDVYNKLKAQKGKDESFSDLFNRLVEKELHGGVNALKKLRRSVEFDEGVKDKILSDITLRRSERRT
jgi:predicted CopG family antitoxin